MRTDSKEPGLLEFNREEKGPRHVDAFAIDACLITTASCYLACPERKPGCIRFTIEKVQVLLTDEELRVIDDIGSWSACIVVEDTTEAILVASKPTPAPVGLLKTTMISSPFSSMCRYEQMRKVLRFRRD